MRVVAALEAPCPPATMYAWVAALDRYPAWLSIVPRAVPLDDADGGRPAWLVDLRARIGPLARSKRLRMVRSESIEGERVVFVREELDGRSHGEWSMVAEVSSLGDGCTLSMELTYEGRFGVSVLERLLADEIERSRERLLELVADGPPD